MLFGGFCFFLKGARAVKRAIGYLCLSAAVFLILLLFLYIGFISPAKTGNDSPFIRMAVCTLLALVFASFFTRYIHPFSGLAGLDSANLNLGFTIAILLAVFVEYVTFGNTTVEPYMDGLVQKTTSGAVKGFYSYIKYVFMVGQLIVAARTFIHSAFLGLLKAIMKHAD